MSERNIYEAAPGTTVKYRTVGDLGEYTELANLDLISGLPEQVAEKFEVTRLNQADLYKQYGFSWIEPGELALAVGFDEDHVDTIDEMFLEDLEWMIELPSGANFTFVGTIYKKGLTMEKGGEHKRSFAVQCQGEVEFNKAA